jgi:hypothetical protein
MANYIAKMAVLVFILNLFVYLGIAFTTSLPNSDGSTHELNKDLKFHFENDLVDEWLGGRSSVEYVLNGTKDNWTSYGYQVSGNISTLPDKTGGSFGEQTTFIDNLGTVWKYLRTLGNIAQAPLTLLFNNRIPSIIGVLIGFPYFIAFMFGIIFFARSG